MTDPTTAELMRSFLMQVIQYNKAEAALDEAHVIAMSDEEIERATVALLEMMNDLTSITDLIHTARALQGGGDIG